MGKRLFFSVVFGVLLCFGVADKAQAIGCNQAHVFVTGETLTASILNANPANFVTCFTQIDNSNVGALGFYASQIIPTSVGQATFGGTQSYTFNNGLTVSGLTTLQNLTVTGTFSLTSVLPIASGGTNASSFTVGALLFYNGTAFTSATVSSPITFSGGALGCATCITTAGGQTISGALTLTGTFTAPTINDSGLSVSGLVATDGSKNLTSSVSGLSPAFTGLNLSGLTASLPLCTDGSKNLTSSCNGVIATIYNSSGTVLSTGLKIIHTVQFSCSADGNGNCTTGTVTWTTAFTSSSTYNLGGCTYIAGGGGVVAALEPISTTSADAKMKGNGSTTLTLNCDLIGY